MRGGQISTAITVNATKRCTVRVACLILTLKNRILFRKKIRKACENCGIHGWTVMQGRGEYVSPEGRTYRERCVTVEVIGVTSETLSALAEQLVTLFHQRSVLVHDYNKNEFVRVGE